MCVANYSDTLQSLINRAIKFHVTKMVEDRVNIEENIIELYRTKRLLLTGPLGIKFPWTPWRNCSKKASLPWKLWS